ncbi:MAG: sigma-70 family RNA polymerase sigma factor [Acidobacteriaceae bacterium]
MFEFISDRQLPRASAQIVASRQQKQSVAVRQRDIYDSHRHRAFALAYYMTGNEIEAEQILTSTFVAAFRATEEPTGPDVDSALIRELRQRSLLNTMPDAPLPAEPPVLAPDPAVPAMPMRNVKRTDLEEAIQELPPADRFLFLLRDVEGYTPAAIADLL